jgi:hypothetical protein
MTQENNVGRQSKLQRRGNGGAVEMYVVKLEGTRTQENNAGKANKT